jgi:hypothetical protein
MEQTIAVYTKADGTLGDYFECKKIDIYKKKEQEWSKISSISMDYSNIAEPCLIRDHTCEILEQITDCKVIVGGCLTGLPFHIFDKKCFQIFDVNNVENETFDGIMSEIQDNDYNARMQRDMIQSAQPVETHISGNYHLDLIGLMKSCPDVTSKKALMDFIKYKPFMELTLRCSHIPPWLESMNLDIKKIKDQNGDIVALITKIMA